MIQLCIRFGLSASQVLFLDALWRGEREEIADGLGIAFDPPAINVDSLLMSGFIQRIDPDKDSTLLNIDITDKTRAMFGEVTADALFDEFVDAYPRFLWIDGKRVAALNADMEELQESYEKNVVKKGLHSTVMAAVKWAAKHHEIHMGIKLWLSSRQWTAIQEIMSDTTGQTLPGARLL